MTVEERITEYAEREFDCRVTNINKARDEGLPEVWLLDIEANEKWTVAAPNQLAAVVEPMLNCYQIHNGEFRPAQHGILSTTIDCVRSFHIGLITRMSGREWSPLD